MVFDAIANLLADRNDYSIDDIKMDTRFSDLGIDSLDTVEMLMELENELGAEIELDEKVETVGELVEFVERKLAEAE